MCGMCVRMWGGVCDVCVCACVCVVCVGSVSCVGVMCACVYVRVRGEMTQLKSCVCLKRDFSVSQISQI